MRIHMRIHLHATAHTGAIIPKPEALKERRYPRPLPGPKDTPPAVAVAKTVYFFFCYCKNGILQNSLTQAHTGTHIIHTHTHTHTHT